MADTKLTKYLEITRVIDAPREKVWKAWTEPDMFKKWWSPKGFTTPVAEMDVRVGGKFFGAMEGGPEMGEFAGKRYYSTGVYKEIVPMEKLVTTDSFADEHGNVKNPADVMPGMENWPAESTVTVTFEDAGEGQTKITLKHGPFPDGEQFHNTEEGWVQTLDKLSAILEREA